MSKRYLFDCVDRKTRRYFINLTKTKRRELKNQLEKEKQEILLNSLSEQDRQKYAKFELQMPRFFKIFKSLLCFEIFTTLLVLSLVVLKIVCGISSAHYHFDVSICNNIFALQDFTPMVVFFGKIIIYLTMFIFLLYFVSLLPYHILVKVLSKTNSVFENALKKKLDNNENDN